MDSWEALLKFLKDKNAVLRKLNTIQPSKGEKIKWTEVKPAFRPDSLTIALQDLKAYNDLKKNKGKGGEFSTHQNIGMYTTTTNTFNTEEEDQTTKNFVVGNERKLI